MHASGVAAPGPHPQRPPRGQRPQHVSKVARAAAAPSRSWVLDRVAAPSMDDLDDFGGATDWLAAWADSPPPQPALQQEQAQLEERRRSHWAASSRGDRTSQMVVLPAKLPSRVAGRQLLQLRREQGGEGGGRARPSPAAVALDKRIWQVQEAGALLALIEASVAEFSHVHATNALTKLAQLLRRAGAVERRTALRHAALPRLFAVLQQQAATLQARDVCASLQALAWLRAAPPGGLLAALGDRAAALVPAAAPAATCHAAWALAKLGYRSNSLLAEVERHALQGADHGWLRALPCASLATLLWACARAGYRSPALLQAAAGVLTSKGGSVQQLQPAQLSMVAWSYATLKWNPGEELLEQLAAAAQAALPSLTSQGLSNLAWALGKLGHVDIALLEGLAAEAAGRLHEFRPQELCMLLSGAAAARQRHPALLAAAAQRLAELAPSCGARDLADAVSALATLGWALPAEAAAAVAARAEQLLPHFPPAWLSWLLWGLARSGHRPQRLLRAAEGLWQADRLRLYEYRPQELARLCWALAEMQHYSGRLLDALALVLRDSVAQLPPQSLAMVLHSYARLQHTPHELLDAAAEHLAANLPSYGPQAVAVSLWSFATLGVHPGRGLPEGGACTEEGLPVMAALAARAIQLMGASLAAGVPHAEQLSVQGVSMLLWSFATLEHHPGDEVLAAASNALCAALQQQQQQQHGGPSESLVSLQAVSNICWALAKFGRADEQLFAAVARALPALLAAQPAAEAPQAVANLAYAAAKLRVSCAPLVEQLQAAAETYMLAFHADELCNVLWAFATLEHPLPPTALLAAEQQLALHLPSCDAGLVCLAVWALGAQQHRASDTLLAACVQHAAAALGSSGAAEDVPPSLLCKLVWGCAHVGYRPTPEELAAVEAGLQRRLSRGNATALPSGDLVLLLWALAVLGRQESPLYCSAAFRASRLPEGVPATPALVRLLRQAAALHARTPAGGAAAEVLPVWLVQPVGAAATLHEEEGQMELEERQVAEAARDVLRAAGRHAAVRRLACGTRVVLLTLAPGSHAAVLPWHPRLRVAGRTAQPLGSALGAQQLLEASGMEVVVASSPDSGSLAAMCSQLSP